MIFGTYSVGDIRRGIAMNRFKIVFVLLISLLIFGCHKKPTPPQENIVKNPTAFFPLTAGNSWYYKSVLYTVTPSGNYATDSLVSMIHRVVVGPSMLRDSLQTFLVVDSTFNSDYLGRTLIEQFWIMTRDSLVGIYGSLAIFGGIPSDTFYLNEPNNFLNMPLIQNKRWNTSYFDQFIVQKRVTGTAIAYTGMGPIECDVMEYRLPPIGEGAQDSTLVKEAYSNDGLIASVTDYGEFAALDSIGAPANFRRYKVMTLRAFDLK